MSDAARAWPDQLGEFRVTGILGEGAHGTVYAAERELTHSSATSAPRRLALKVLRENALSFEQKKAFMQEATLLAAIDHPGVVKVFGFGMLPDHRPYLAMERLEGEPLAARLRRGPLVPSEAFALFAQLGEALAALHAQGLLHRDVKPENIFLTYGVPYGAGERQAQAVLFDFGLVENESDYMAPERVLGAPASVASEVFELATTLFAMLCGRLPWDEHGSAEARLHPRTPSAVGVPLPEDMEAELMRALSSKVERRPSSVRILADRVSAAAIATGLAAPRRRTLDVPTLSDETARARLAEEAQKAAALGDASLPAPAATGDLAAAAAIRKLHWRRLALLLGALALTAAVGLVVVRAVRNGKSAASSAAHDAGAAAAPHGGAASTDESPLPAQGPRHASHTDRVPDEIWKHHPRDTVALAALSWTQVLAAPPVRLALGERAARPVPPALARVMRACGFDPIAELEWISIGVGAGAGGKNLDVMIAGRWTRDELEPCVVGLLSSALARPTLVRDGRVTRLEHAGKTTWLGWLDEHTFLFSTRAAASRPWIEARLDGLDSAEAGAALAAERRRVDGAQTLWLLAFPAAATKTFGPGTPAPAVARGGLRVFDDVRGEVIASFTDPKDAAKLLSAAAAYLEAAHRNGSPLGAITVIPDGRNDLIFRIDLDKEATAAFVNQCLDALVIRLETP